VVRAYSSGASRLSRSLVDGLRRKIEADQFEFSKHAVDQSILRRISVQEVRDAIANGEIIEEYPEDKYWPSYLIYGRTAEGRPLHVQCSHPSRPLIKIVTLYEPDPARWIDFRERRSR
jgi:Domain of unknown function (DUF4258)